MSHIKKSFHEKHEFQTIIIIFGRVVVIIAKFIYET